MCDKAVYTHPLTMKYVSECCKAQEICNIVDSLYPFLIVYCPDKCITQKRLYPFLIVYCPG